MIGPAIVARLTAAGTQTQALVGNAVVPDVNMASGTSFVVFDPDDGESDITHGGPSGLTQHNVAISAVGPTRLACEALADAVKADLDGQKGTWGTVKVLGAFLVKGDAQVYPIDDGANRKSFAKDLEFLIWKST